MAEAVSLLGLPISQLGLEQALEHCLELARTPSEGGAICFVNVHTLTEAEKSLPLRAALQDARLRFADGMPLVWLARIKGTRIPTRACGPDFMARFLRLADEQGYLQAIVGGKSGQAERIAKATGVRGQVLAYSPPFRDFSPENAAEDWVRLLQGQTQAPRIVWVGLGAPKQELWMQAVSRLAPHTLFFGIGAALDFLGGDQRRAPQWMRQCGLEWLHRLSREPKRLGRRYWVSNTRFVIRAAGDLLKR